MEENGDALFELYLDLSRTLIFNTIDVWKFQSGLLGKKGLFSKPEWLLVRGSFSSEYIYFIFLFTEIAWYLSHKTEVFTFVWVGFWVEGLTVVTGVTCVFWSRSLCFHVQVWLALRERRQLPVLSSLVCWWQQSGRLDSLTSSEDALLPPPSPWQSGLSCLSS